MNVNLAAILLFLFGIGVISFLGYLFGIVFIEVMALQFLILILGIIFDILFKFKKNKKNG